MLGSGNNLPSIQRLKYEDYADAKSWQDAMQGLISSLNLFISPVYQIINGDIGYQNLAVPKTFTQVITASTTTTFNFTNPLHMNATAVILGNVYIGTKRDSHPAVVCQVMWHQAGPTIFIDNVIGLTSGVSYTLSLVIF